MPVVEPSAKSCDEGEEEEEQKKKQNGDEEEEEEEEEKEESPKVESVICPIENFDDAMLESLEDCLRMKDREIALLNRVSI